MSSSRKFSVWVLSLVAVSSPAQADEALVQADVYSALYEAYTQCDGDFEQRRSEFITDKLERGSGEITVEALRKILSQNLQAANDSVAQKTKEREIYWSRILEPDRKPSDQDREPDEANEDPHRKVRAIDEFLKEKRRYVEVHECVLKVL